MVVYQDKKSKKWYVKRSWYDIDGKRHYLTRRGFKTKREAEKTDNKLAVEIDDGIDVTENPIFADYYDDWVKIYKKGNVAPNTLIEYNLEGKRIRKLLGAAKIKNINRSKYQKVINEFGANHAKNTVKKLHRAIRTCVKSAIQDGIITRDFTENIQLAFNKDHDLKVDYLEYDEIKLLLNHLYNAANPNFPGSYMILLGLTTGLRESEMAGLKWKDLDFEDNTIKVRRSWVYSQKEYGPTKNESSVRPIGVPDFIMKKIKELKINDPEKVFWSKARNGFPNSKSLNRTLRDNLAELKIKREGYHIHSLRHSQVAILLSADVSTYDIAQRLGHATTKTTEEIYAETFEKHRQKIDFKVNSVFNNLKKNA